MRVQLLKSTQYGEAGHYIEPQPNVADILISRGIAKRADAIPPVPAANREPKRKAAKTQ